MPTQLKDLKDLALKDFIEQCITIANDFSNGTHYNSVKYYSDDFLEINKGKQEELTITIYYVSENGYKTSNPVVCIAPDGEIFRTHGEWTNLKNYPLELLQKLQLKDKIENELNKVDNNKNSIKNKI